ncbi:hypothetical protein [Nonomuraea sp. NPDC049480]|uniref:hypothetical protein n=1 Tax=Nonomuraea sp. NPDC049480 TaxID=3364353 RepID=UPI0037ABC72D
MKRWTKIMVLTLGALSLTSLPASSTAEALDPVTAIQRQLVKGKGVRIDDRRTFNGGGYGGWERFKPVKGIVGFGNGKVVATDLRDYNFAKSGLRNICIGKRAWQYEPKKLPKGKTWVTYPWECELRLQSGYVRFDAPAVFEAVLATTASKKPGNAYEGIATTYYEGAITLRQLWEVEPALRVGFDEEDGDRKIDWRLWIGKDQLVRRAWTKWRVPEPEALKGVSRGQGWFGYIHDVRYSEWGMKVAINPPSAAQTIDNKKVER